MTKLSSTTIPRLRNKQYLLKHRRHRDVLIRHLYKAWFDEYILCLQNLEKRKACTLHPQKPIKIGDICLLKDHTLLKQFRYPLVQVVNTVKCRNDDSIRTVHLRVLPEPMKCTNLSSNSEKAKFISRDIRSISQLEMNDDDDDLYS